MGCWLSQVDEEPVSVAYSGYCQQLGKEVLISKGSWKVIRKHSPLCDVKEDLVLTKMVCRENGAELALAMYRNKAERSERGAKMKCSEVLGRLGHSQNHWNLLCCSQEGSSCRETINKSIQHTLIT